MKNHLLSLLLLLPLFPAFANETSSHPQGTWWINGGLGAGWLLSHAVDDAEVNNTNPTELASASFNYALFDNQYIELRAMGSRSFFSHLLCTSLGCSDVVNKVSDVGVLYGIMKKEKWYMVGGSAGLAYTEVEYGTGTLIFLPSTNSSTSEHSYRDSSTLGIPLEIQLFFTPFKYVGIGLVGIANLNTEASMAGVLLALQVGKLR